MSKWTFKQIEPQPARGTLREEMWDSPDWIAEEKYDGDRRIAQFCEAVGGRQSLVRFTGRRVSVKDGKFVEKSDNVPHLSGYTFRPKGAERFQIPRHLPPADLTGTVLDGEMIVDPDDSAVPSMEGKSKYVTSIMGSLPEEAVRKQIERGWLRYVVFDCLFYQGKDVRGHSLGQRKGMARIAVAKWSNPFVSLAADEVHLKQAFYDRIVMHGGEGVILKHRDHKYGDKKLWVKVKKQATADVVIMGFIPAKEMSVKKGDDKATLTKYAKAGLIGAIQCGQYHSDEKDPRHYLIEVATVSGMTDALRIEFTKHPKKYIGVVVEIEHNGREPTGRFRHPRLKDNDGGFRSDKKASDCVYREDES